MSTVIPDKTYFPVSAPNDSDQLEAMKQVAHGLEDAIRHLSNEAPTLTLHNNSTIHVELPPTMLDMLLQITQAMSQGLAISIVPHNMMLSTQEAADLLGISRPTLVRMVEEGKIPFEKKNRHRRLYLRDVVQYRERQRRDSNEALDDMVADTEMYGFYDLDPEDVNDALREVRKTKKQD